MAQTNEALTPKNQGTAGHIASGITETVSAGVVGAPLGAFGIATTVGIASRASEHTRLTQQLGVDQETADTASNLYGATNAVLAGLPVANVFKASALLDYGALVIAPTIAGQGMSYVEGAYLENKGYKKLGESYKESATDPSAFLMNLGIGSAFFALGRLRTDPNATQQQIYEAEAKTYQAVDQALAEVDAQSSPTHTQSVSDLMQHEANLNTAIDQVIKGEKVNIAEATDGQLKTLNDVRNYIKNSKTVTPKVDVKTTKEVKPETKPFTAQGTQKRIYDEALAKGLSDADARTIVALAHFESRGTFSTTVKNPKSSATGVFQFIDDTWKAEGGTASNRHDLDTQINLGIQHTKKNIQYIEDKTGVVLTGSQIYIPHLLGRGGAEIVFKAIKENPNQSARDVISRFSKDPDHLMRINGIPKDARIDDAVHFFTKKIDDITAKYYGGTGSKTDQVFTDLVETVEPVKDISNLDTTVHRTDLDTFPDLNNDFISSLDFDAFNFKNMDQTINEAEAIDIPHFAVDQNGKLTTDTAKNHKDFSGTDSEITKLLEQLFIEHEKANIPYTADGIKVKNSLNDPAKEFKPDPSITTEWEKTKRYEQGKYHDQLTRSFKDKDGNTVQELQYRGSYVNRTVDSAGKTVFIRAARANKSDFVNHVGNKELETALNRVFDTNSYGYLSQIPKGHETIAKLEAHPDLVISSKKTGEDLTAAQWKDKLQKEQDNIIMMAKAMSTLAKCALQQAS